MTFEEQGAYMRLLCKQADKGPMTIDFVRRILKNSFEKIWPAIKSKFVETDDGHFFNERIEIEKGRRKKFLQSVKNNGMKGGRPKKNLQVIETETEIKPIGYDSVKQNESILYANGNAIGLGKSENPLPDDDRIPEGKIDPKMELPINVLEVAEMNQFTHTQKRNTEFLQQQWKVFLRERIAERSGKKYFRTSDVTSHFLNWVRNKFPTREKAEQEQKSTSPPLRILR